MSFKNCSIDGRRITGKPAASYAWWYLADGDRSCWKQNLCADCLIKTYSDVLRHASDETADVTMCPACGCSSAGDLDPIYWKIYLPKQDPREFALPTCAGCAAKLRVSLQTGAERQPNRDQAASGVDFTARDEFADLPF